MKRFIQGDDRSQSALFPECLDDHIADDNPVKAIEVFVYELNLGTLGFDGAAPKATGRPAYHPATLLKLYIYGYLNRIQSSRRRERETRRNLELIWLTGRLMPDFKTIADFRKDNGAAIRPVCREFIVLCRNLNLFPEAIVRPTAASSRRSTTGTRISRIGNFRLACSSLRRAWGATWPSSIVPTGNRPL